MRETKYQEFSLKTHQQNWQAKKPNVCQWELTFKCGLHCRHCYTDCYNKEEFFRRQVNTAQAKAILDRIFAAGVIWLCFTGGDPLARDDFLEIYAYAKQKGFILTIFTNGYSMTPEIAGYLAQHPPFAVEMTLNAAGADLYEKITQVKGSFSKTTRGIKLMRQAKLPLKIKTQVTKDNFSEVPRIKEFVRKLGLPFGPSIDLHARLNGDTAPCRLRIPPRQAFRLSGAKLPDCPNKFRITMLKNRQTGLIKKQKQNTVLFRCAMGGGDGFYVDPYGNMSLCNLIRDNSVNLLKKDLLPERDRLLSLVRNKKFTTEAPCQSCRLRQECLWCPGRAYVEMKDAEAPIKYYCELAQLQTSV